MLDQGEQELEEAVGFRAGCPPMLEQATPFEFIALLEQSEGLASKFLVPPGDALEGASAARWI
ncbi:MAG: hypothetical protein GY946_33245, partial [bacterium]|nr:hypothetical protein [bacterium]